MAQSSKAPPKKTDDISYENWKQEVEIWAFQTTVEAAKQGGALFLSLEGKPRQTVLAEVGVAKINHADGTKNIFACLDAFYKQDESKVHTKTLMSLFIFLVIQMLPFMTF